MWSGIQAWHVRWYADRSEYCRGLLMQTLARYTYARLPLLHGRLTAPHTVPFPIWHRHVVFASDRCCTLLVPEVTHDLLDCLFFSHTALVLWRWPPLLPQAPRRSRGLFPLVFWNHIYLKWALCVLPRETGAEWVNLYVNALACERTWTWIYMFRRMPH